VSGEISRLDGHVAKFMGDGVLAYFGWPTAHENDAERAVRAGLAVAAAVGGLVASNGEPLAARIGIATGLVVVGDLIGKGSAREEVAVGETPNLAARLQAAAPPGAVVVAEATRRLAGGLFEYDDLGALPAKGFATPPRAWRVLGEIVVASRFEALRSSRTPLIGRGEELHLLLRRWQQAKGGEGQVVLLAGEPGIGKSRLAVALLERLKAEPHARISFPCSPHLSHSPLAPAINHLERAAGFRRGDTLQQKRDRLEALLAPSSPTLEERVLLAELLSLSTGGAPAAIQASPQQRKQRTLAALIRQFEVLTQQTPVWMLWEDVHWIDPSSRELLDLLVARASDLPVLLVITFRREFVPTWAGAAHVTLLALRRLGRRDSSALIEHVAGENAFPAEVLDQILARTDGVPLFLEELTKAVLESGHIREEDGGDAGVGPFPPVAVPSGLQASLMARLDRSASLRDVAQIGAAIGREFSYELLAAVSAKPADELGEALAQLTSTELVLARGQPPAAVYTFKHALVQDAAYGTLLRARRVEIHDRIAAAMRAHCPDLVQRQPEILARHLAEAGLAVDAIACWLQAGQLAAAKSANFEAVAHLGNGLALIPHLPHAIERDRAEQHLQTVLGPALNSVKGYGAPETMAAFERAQELMRRTGDRSQKDSVLTGLYLAYFDRAEFPKVHEVATEFLDGAERQEDAAPKCIGHRMVAASLNAMGDFRGACPHAELALALYDPEGHGPLAWRYAHDLGVAALNHMGVSLWHAGHIERSLQREREALGLADRLQHPNTTGYALFFCGGLSALRRRDFAELRRFAQRLRDHARERGMPHWGPFGMCLEGTALAPAGRAEEGIALIQEGLQACEMARSRAFRPAFLAGLAEAQLVAGQWDGAGRTAEAALRESAQTLERWMDAELWRLQGQCAVLSGAHAWQQAEALFRRAAECAESQGSRPLHLRAMTSLARLRRDQSRSDEARDLLALACDWFTEGLDTPDLIEARALLKSLT
jgi:predicted ATPase